MSEEETIDDNIRKLERICGRLQNESLSPFESQPPPTPIVHCFSSRQQVPLSSRLAPQLTQLSFSQRLVKIQKLYQKQIADLQLDLKKCIDQLTKVRHLLQIQKQLSHKYKIELEECRQNESTRLKEFRFQVEQEFLQSMSEVLMKKDDEIEKLRKQTTENMTRMHQQNLQLKHNIVHLKAELVQLQKSLQSLKGRHCEAAFDERNTKCQARLNGACRN